MLLHQLMDPRGTYLENYRWADECQKLSSSIKAEYFTQLSDALIVQLNILKYIGGVCKKVIPNLGIDQEVSLWGNWMVMFGIITRENNLIVDIVHQKSR